MRHPSLKQLCVTAACAAVLLPSLATAASYQHRVSLRGLVVSGPGAALDNLSVALATSQLPDAIVGVPYSANLNQLLSVTGDAAYSGEGVTWGVLSNSLPAGLYLTTDGYIGGTPTAEGVGDIQVRASYKTANGEQTYQVVSIPLAVALSSATLPAATVGQAYAYDFKPLVSSNDPAFSGAQASFSATSLPAGLSLATDGTLTGAPAVKNEAGASFQVVASYKTKTGQQAYTIVVNGAPLQATQLTAGDSHTCVVTTSGGVKCWGYNAQGQLGNNSTANSLVPVDVAGLTAGVVSVAAGSFHTCAVSTSGGTKCWGRNYYGALGNNSTTDSTVPVNVTGLTSGVASVSAGGWHTCAVTTSGGVKCWGRNSEGQLGNNSTTNSSVPVDASGLTSGVARVTGGRYHLCAVTTSGGAKCWGRNSEGQLGNNSTTQSLVPVDVAGLTSGVASVAAAGAHTCAVTTSGGAKCWGRNSEGQLGNNSTTNSTVPVNVTGLTSGVASVSAGIAHNCAVTSSGGAKCWGINGAGQLGNNSTTVSKVPVDVIP